MLSAPEYPLRPPNTAGVPGEAQHSRPHRGLLPFPWAQGGLWGWGLCRDSSLPTAGKQQHLSQGFSACPGSGRGTTRTRWGGDSPAAHAGAGRQGTEGAREEPQICPSSLTAPWLKHMKASNTKASVPDISDIQACEKLSDQLHPGAFSPGRLSVRWFEDTGWGTCGTSSLACPRATWSCLGAMSLPVPHSLSFPACPSECCGATLPPDTAWHPPKARWSLLLARLRLNLLWEAAPAEEKSLPKTHTRVLDSCWLQLSITVQLVQLPQSARFLTGKRWFLELETFSCENGSFDKGLSFCDRDNQNEKSHLESKCKEIENWNSYTFCFDISHSKLLKILSPLCENVPFLIF